uniref:CSN8_PSD8_EIF3K domain-containing protein n=1 Tax=Angiostrongylus cantonensis TaxID=6313 RepID=A0A0K0DBC4_ANGCA
MIGCVYSDAVMEKVRKMGSGIMEKANSLYLENQSKISMNGNVAPIKAAPTTTPDPPKVVPNLARNPTRVNSEDSYIEEKMKQIKIYLLQADYRASAMEMLNQATGRARSPWTKQGPFTLILYINMLIFRILDEITRFKQPNVDWTECAVNAIVETFLHGENIMVKGWSQKVDIRIGDLLAFTRVLSKGECVRAKLDNAIDEMCAKISEIIARGSPDIVQTEHGLELR